MKQSTKQTCGALLLLCGLFSFNTFASTTDHSKLDLAAKHLSSMSNEQKQAARQALGQLTPEQKSQIKKTLKEKYNELSDEDKARLKSKLSGFVVSHPQALRVAVEKLSNADKQRIVDQIIQRVESKLHAMPTETRKVLYADLKQATTPQQRLHILSAAVGRIGEVTYGVTGDDILTALKDMSLDELSTLFGNLATAINDSIYSDTMLGSDLYQLFDGLSDVLHQADQNMGDSTGGSYVPLFMRTPHAAKCRSKGPTVNGEAISCDVTETNVFWEATPYGAGRIVERQSVYITLTCAEGWTAEGEYCTHPSIPGAGVKAEINFANKDIFTSGGEREKFVYNDHFNVENQSAINNVGDGPHPIDDLDEGCSGLTLDCRQGNGLYRSHTGGFGDLSVNVTWAILHPSEYSEPSLSKEALNNLHPFNVEYEDGDKPGVGAQEMKDQGVKNMFIVTNFEAIAASCEVTQPEQTVDLGTVWAGDVDHGVVESSMKPFEIGLSCTGTQTDYMPAINITTAAETGIEMIGNEAIGYLKNEYVGANAADNVGVVIYQDLPSGKLAVPAFNAVSNYAQEFDLSSDANPTLKFQAAFFKPDPRLSGELKAGKFEANITVEMIYL